MRLATSVKIVNDSEEELTISLKAGCDAILDGYQQTLKRGGCPLVLAEHEQNLEKLGIEAIDPAPDFWKKLNDGHVNATAFHLRVRELFAIVTK